MHAIILSFFTFLSTVGGGLIAFRHKERLHLIMSLTAGVLMGVIFFDIMPEIFELTREHQLDPIGALLMLVGGFLLIHVLEKFAIMHHEHEDVYPEHGHKHPTVGIVSAGGLAFHSFLDGVGIGLAFQVSPQVGILVALAVIAHDFSDGLNTVTIMLSHRNTHRRTRTLLAIDALAPVIGAASTLLFHIPNNILLLYLGFFAGFLLYIASAELLPEAHSKHSSWKMIFLTVAGASFIFLVTRFV